MTRHLFFVVGALLLSVASVRAAPFCIDDAPDFEITTGFSIGQKFTETDRNEFDLMHLRQLGIDATRVERWNGCIRAFVRKPEGGEEMQFFQPGTYERVE
ncbi:hypothetical protein VW35_19515 [Devosia soli]|uniref:Beta/gamma crystallin 'Greek key' domain-containing protein n=1 Tax=Devosia soli TaxID=361041 RepID=A0A0F5L147_9HYPH|nr:hypothetical protein [Devosia soli]KKB75934.1 hypothetical protein VW35_19515 [Devosia soli]